MPHFLNTEQADFEDRFRELLSMKREDSPEVAETVAGIVADVRKRGDAALIELTKKFDRFDVTPETLAFSKAGG